MCYGTIDDWVRSVAMDPPAVGEAPTLVGFPQMRETPVF
jgi:hypothetical protein